MGPLNSMVRGLLDQRGYGNQFESASLLSKRFSQSHQSPNFHSSQLTSPHLSSSHLSSSHLSSSHLSSSQLSSPNLSSLLHGSSIAELAGANGLNVPVSNNLVSNGLGGLNSSGLNPYEKWSNGSDSLFGLTPTPQPSQDAFKVCYFTLSCLFYTENNDLKMESKILFQDRLSISQPPSDMIDLTSKFMSSTNLSPSSPMTSVSPLYPPKSQIKRQKMIYHCKFGEFGILEGQFTEPSGVAVNAQNDIIVADTNNHR